MAPVDPKAKLVTYFYPKGSATATKGLMEFIFGTRTPSWRPSGTTGARKRPYGGRQRDSRQAGQDLTIQLSNGDSWTMRITGTHTAFLDEFLSKADESKVIQIYSERGTIYGPQFFGTPKLVESASMADA